MYDHYISLGINCEAGFQFRRALGRDRSSFFNWNVTPPDALEKLLECDFADIGLPENLRFEGNGTLVRDVLYDYHFHWLGERLDSVNDGASDEFRSNRSRLDHLVEKFRTTLRAGSRIAFFYTCNGGDVLDRLPRIEALLDGKHGAKEFTLVALLSAEHAAQARTFESPRLVCRTVKRFAPWSDATDGHVSSWDALFREFPHASPMTLAGY
ncbi:hypothetical protein DIE23_23120 [Burkholderia sp. Bp9143]|uniref:hypothetical protein n=1 Tax=Burkholderia sp. Bp9143 TaxID=2184574 RepID=UPI000F594234|nr:hypothetical protein [Burkholderia sp. Bp9143]RQR28841.1 hypothetical protein DIE23_23120 [Burkholderia sp. Bp9143]